jgi:PAS domain S-box-containing protein
MPEAPGPKGQDRFFRLVIPADLSELSKARRLMEEVGRAAELPDDRIFDLQVAVSEAAANAIEHAASEVEVAAWLLADRVIVEITNDGAFQPGLYKDDEHRRRGLGLPLMVSLADQVHVARLPEGKTRVSLTFFLGGARRPDETQGQASRSPESALARLEAETMKLDVLSQEREQLLAEVDKDQEDLTASHAELEASERLLRAVTEGTSDMIFVKDRESRLVMLNPATARSIGKPADELLGRNDAEFFDPEIARRILEIDRRVMDSGRAEVVEEVVDTPKGRRTFLTTKTPRLDGEGRVIGLIGMGRDITERKQIEESLRLTQLSVDRTADLVHWVASDGRLVYANNSSCRRFGYSHEEMLTKTVFDLDPAMTPEAWSEHWQELKTRGSMTFESLHRTKGGELYPVEVTANYFEAGRQEYNIAFVRDITERKKVDEILREGEKDLVRAQELAKAGSWRLDTRRNELRWSDETYRIFGISKEVPLAYESFLGFAHPDDRQYVDEQWTAALTGQPYDIEHRIVVDAEVRWVREKAELEFDPQGALLGGFGSVQDITDRKRGEEALRESEERFRTMADAIPQLAWIAGADGYIYWYNQRWYEYTGTTLADMEGWGWQSVHDPDALPAVLARWQESIATGQPFDMEFPLRGADGELRPFLTRVMPLKDAAGRVTQWFGTNTDVTERKRAEEARRRNEESLAGVLSSVGRLRLFERRKPWQVLLIGAALQAALFIGVSHLGSPNHYLGIPGAATALIAVVAAIIAGPVAGMAVALAGGVAYFAFLTDFGRSVMWPAIIGSILLWTLAAAVAGLAGDWVRHNATLRERLLAHMLAEREAMSDSLGVTNAGLQAQTEELEAQNEDLQEAQQEIVRLLEEQSSLLLRLQEALLDIPQELPGVKFAHLYRSATLQAQVGGDFYDVFEAKEGRIGLLIGDVSGHGVEAARIASLAKDTVHAFAHQFRDPHLVLREANRLLVEKRLPGFVTVFLGFLDPESGVFVYSSAGHPAPLLATDGHMALLQSIGSPLGVFADASYQDSETEIREGSLLLFYTDGITEARRDSDLFGEQRLAEALGRMRDQPLETLPSLLLDEALLFSGGLLRDDVALLAVSYLGKTGDRLPSGCEQA